MKPNNKTTARIAGFLYLSIFIIAPLSLLYLPSTLIVPGDALATATNINDAASLFRIGIAGDAVLFMIEVALAAIFYVLLRPVNKTLSLISAFSRLGEAFIMGLNVLVHLFVLHLANSAEYLTAFDPNQVHALVELFLRMHDNGILVGQVFFGFHLVTLGILLYKSGYFPRVLGVLLMVASIGYLLESFGNFVLPKYEEIYATVVILLAAIPELSFTLWLLVKGVRPLQDDEPAPASPLQPVARS
jgi:hypothetical protein